MCILCKVEKRMNEWISEFNSEAWCAIMDSDPTKSDSYFVQKYNLYIGRGMLPKMDSFCKENLCIGSILNCVINLI